MKHGVVARYMLYEFSDRQLSTARKLLLPTGRKETIHATFISSELLMENELNTNLPRRTLAEYIHCRLSFYLDLWSTTGTARASLSQQSICQRVC